MITRFRGVFRQVDVYRRGDNLYAQHGFGFVKLMGHPNTTAPGISWDKIEPHDQIEDANIKWK